ncbi:hypothetical protein [Leptolyngbya sp. FACHB-671]|nr:hypothetical protein [Leptolyngbya sp. FACHB-671]
MPQIFYCPKMFAADCSDRSRRYVNFIKLSLQPSFKTEVAIVQHQAQ